ncbi:hypothetical protein QAD02_017585 [Eretmocerus hayati]|uniref:Uncharacterized protein n=1 Tax=Eretmocerus hayati TaxID=131215 RepID=A0ACC2PFF6_9HYME|nr:hypothetical protein QAD02_017585 [Eretmocerus hayati]
MAIVKVWNGARTNRRTIVINKFDDSLTMNNVLEKANEKLEIQGVTIVLESDGTIIDCVAALAEFQSEKFIILQADETYQERDTIASSPPSQLNLPLQDRDQNSSLDSSENSSDSPNSDTDQENRPKTPENVPTAKGAPESVQSSPDLITKTLQSRRIKCWSDFKIPWASFSPEILLKLQQRQRNDDLVVQCIRRVVSEMRYFKTTMNIKVCRPVAQAMVEKFPETFEDRKLDGTRLGNGFSKLADQIMQHNSNLNRPNKRGKSLNKDLGVPPAKRKLLSLLQTGCPNWQPEKHPQGDNEETIEVTRNKLLDYKNTNYNSDELELDFKRTFAAQRFFLNNQTELPTAQDVFISWPIIFDPKYQLQHFAELTSKDPDTIKKNLRVDLEAIIHKGAKDYGVSVEKEASEHEKIITSLKIIFMRFKEPFDYLSRLR